MSTDFCDYIILPKGEREGGFSCAGLFQLTIWTVLVLSACTAVALQRIQADSEDPLAIEIDWKLWALLGISITSFVATPHIGVEAMIDAIIHTESQRQLRSQVREFVSERIIPIANDFDARGEVPETVYHAFFDTGLLHGYIPQKYGGRGHSAVDTSIIAEELAFGCGAIAAALIAPILPISLLILGATERQKEKFLRPLASTFGLAALACTEIEAGSDLRSIQTRAIRNGSDYVISGKKTYSSNLPYSELAIVIARTEPGEGQGSPRALSAFVVPTSTPGFVISERWKTLGLRSQAVCPCELHNVVVPKEFLLSDEGDGLNLLNAGLDLSRIMMASMGLGSARRLINVVFQYAKKRQLFGMKLLKFQDYRFRLVKMEEGIAAGKLLVWVAASEYDSSSKCTKEASLAKLHCGKLVQEVASTACVMMGGTGFLQGSIVEKIYREAPILTLIEGSEPIQAEIVYSEMLRRGLY